MLQPDFTRPQAAANWQASISAHQAALVTAYAQRATHFSLSLFGHQVTAEPGGARRKRIAESLARLLPLRVAGLFAAARWLGTSRRGALVLVGTVDADARARLAPLRQPFASSCGWEDLALYSQRRDGPSQVLLWTTTHEQQGAVYAPDADLRNLGLAPERSRLPPIVAEPLDSEAQAAILALAGI